jgi:prepilin-type processing-associated H-X9-DG protein
MARASDLFGLINCFSPDGLCCSRPFMPRLSLPKTRLLAGRAPAGRRTRAPAGTGDWLARRFLSVPLLMVWLVGLWFLRPRPAAELSEAQAQTTSCLSNLSRIGLAFAQYAQDYDGKFPRGTDAEDRFNVRTWQQAYDGYFSDQARTVPMLPEVLAPYLKDNAVWRCPSDTGWDTPNLPGFESGLMNVRPSAYEKFGLSYGYLTLRAFAGLRISDLPQPSLALSLFDSSMWHRREGETTLNILFADGHVATVSSPEFRRAVIRDEVQLSAALQARRFGQTLPRRTPPPAPPQTVPRPLWTPPVIQRTPPTIQRTPPAQPSPTR